jgi:hypothetical protein
MIGPVDAIFGAPSRYHHDLGSLLAADHSSDPG